MSTRSEKAIYWVKLLSKFVSVQLIVQALGFASGILIIRTLSKEEYAYFTIANSMQSSMNVLAASGISSALLSIGGKVFQDSYKFTQLINAGMRLKKYLGMISVLIVTPILFWLLTSSGASLIYALLIIIVILIELYFYLIQGILGVVPLLKSQIKQIQILDLMFSGSRLLFIVINHLTLINALTYAFCSTVASSLKTFYLYQWNKDSLEKNIPINQEYNQQIVGSIRSMIAYYSFFCIQGQITIWLISIFGTTNSIAEIGALGRLSIIFTVITSVVSNIVVPSFAKCESLKLLKLRYFKVMLIYLFLSILLLVVSVIFPKELLWILGNKYNHLQRELYLVILTSMVSAISSVAWSLNTSRGWIKDSWLIIPSTILIQILLLVIIDVSNIKGVIMFGLVSTLPTLLVNFYLNYKGFNNHYYNGDLSNA
ncbi:polysaccharide biosynthesis protein [Anabaena sp. UHCC 0253]|uniref:polysaccharide biosynthesis protein n=1 Tax=Anabaena sp. UHCC 0253 TaxID=2590019 RepID=UPI001446AF15|nr:polysaccharide biosynthesis protein [Anabaena sp. UHCC 0253]MTJ53688.1 polysaccharide biosynthesis protein [Anabaena sp. UHCC 0253]